MNNEIINEIKYRKKVKEDRNSIDKLKRLKELKQRYIELDYIYKNIDIDNLPYNKIVTLSYRIEDLWDFLMNEYEV